jgi:gamma-glutamylcyclotransferase (GGCT)/AIG2-like uncharacterized protein YtfP
MSAEANLLFVYGTLMTQAQGELGADMRARLVSAGQWLGPATIPGRLVALDGYPGLIAPVAIADVVHGEVFELTDPEAVFKWLDDYEGMASEPSPDDAYDRVLTTARLASGGDVRAWVYRYCADTAGAKLIPSGRWES